MGDGDGRLELDELGSVIDHASSLGPAAPEDVLAGNDVPTVRERLESSGVAPWSRRHVLALGIATAVVVSGVVLGVGWKQGQPPPLDPTISATVGDAMADGTAPQVPGTTYDGELALALRVEKVDERDAIEILGVTGPGVRASRAVPAEGASGLGVADVFVIPGCDDPRSFTATFADYHLRVRRTDAYGRVTVGDLTLPSPVAAQLADTSVQNCFQTLVSESVTVTAVALRTDVARRVVHADITLHNGLEQNLRIDGVTGTSSAGEPTVEQTHLLGGESAVQHVAISLNDCSPQSVASGATGPSYGYGSGSAEPNDLSFFTTPSTGGNTSAGIYLTWTAEQRASIAAGERAMCAGAPGATARVLSAVAAPAAVSTAYGFGTPQDGVVLRARVEIRTPASHVVLSDGSYPLGAYVAAGPPTVTTAKADVTHGRVVVTVDWAAQCSSVVGPPPVWLVVTADGTTYPYRIDLGQAALARAYTAACPGTVPGDLAKFGWATG